MRRLKKLSILLMVLVIVAACDVVQPQGRGTGADGAADVVETAEDGVETAEDGVETAEDGVETAEDAGASQTRETATPSARKDRPAKTVMLGYHYKPPTDGTKASKLADKVSFIVLSKNDEEYRDKLREAGYDGLILQYVMANEVDGPVGAERGDACDDKHKPWQNQLANGVGDFCKFLHPNEDWFLHNGEGERLYGMNEDRYFYRMNPASEGWRKFALGRLKEYHFGREGVPPLGYDGFFFDNVELSMKKSLADLENSDGKVKEYRSEREFRKAWQGWLRYMRNRLGSNTPLWANMIAPRHTADEWNDYLPYLDGVMNEAFVTGYDWPLNSSEQTNELRQAEYALAQGKGFYAVSQGKEKDTSRQKFALASYLLVVRPDVPSYFRYTRASGKYDEWWSYDNYKIKLGRPLGPRYAIKNGWRRDFSNGYVTVDQKKRKGKIVQRDS